MSDFDVSPVDNTGKKQLLGLQSLVKFPTARAILVHGQDDFAAAQRMFPQNPVLAWEGGTGALSTYYLGHLETRPSIIWDTLPVPPVLKELERQLAVAGINGGSQIALFAPANPMECYGVAEAETHRLPRQWIVPRLRPYVPIEASQPGQPTPAAVVEPVARAAKPEVVTKPPKTKRATRERTEGTSWADFGLVLSDKGIPVMSLDNCVTVLEKHPDLAGHLWYDSFLSRILHTWGADHPKEWADHNDTHLALYFQRNIGIPKVSPSMAHDAVICYAMRETRNCAYDWLDGLQWDGKERLGLLATLGFGAESTEYTAAVCRNLILSMVKRVFEPGCKSDYMPVFEGSQGLGKSQALEILGNQWFAELHMDWNNKDFYLALQGKMLLEIGEMHAFKQTDVDKIKGIVSCAKDRLRVPFGHNTQDYPRQCVFAGTTNRDDWNRDDTGARRFWPVLCGAIDLAWIRANRDALFAEAVHTIRAGGRHWEVPWGEAQAQQDERRAPDTWDDAVSAWLVGRNKCTVAEVMAGAVDLDAAHQSLSDQQRMGRVMKKMGWIKRNERTAGVQRKVWVNPLALDLEPSETGF